jgi:hypothetical protein
MESQFKLTEQERLKKSWLSIAENQGLIGSWLPGCFESRQTIIAAIAGM